VRHHLNDFLRGDGFRARALRSSALVAIGFGGANFLRLLSNLVLTRLLFPEAFGLMSLVYVFLTGLHLFSDVGLNVSIVQHKRGEEPDFLNTIWSLQIIRGALLWIGACALAYPAALIYEEPRLSQLLPVVGLTALIQGFSTTKVALADRNLQIGVQVMTELGSTFATLVVTTVGAWLTGSVWSLVAGAVFGAALKVVLQFLLLKGPPNRWHLDPAAVSEVLHFGKYIFLGSVAGFLTSQSDRAILGGFVSLTDLGIFTIGLTLANLPIELATTVGGRILFPLFTRFPTSNNTENRARVLKARRLVLLAMVALSGALSIASVAIVDFLYDSRYHSAGPMLALLGFTVTARVAASNYDGSYLGVGDSRQHFFLVSMQAVIQVVISLLLISRFGVVGAVFALGASELLTYVFRARAANRYGAWDPKTDLATLVIGWGCAAIGVWIWHADIVEFMLQR